MEPLASSSSRFRFRDHQDYASAAAAFDQDSDVTSVVSSSTDSDDESELQSMTGKGIKRLCMELVEIKAASDEDFYKNIFANYSAFVGIFEEVKNVEKEVMLLKSHISTQKTIVKELIDGVYLKALSEKTIESIIEESEFNEPPSPNGLEVHIIDFSETLDLLLSENRIDEAIAIIEMEEENLGRVQLEENIPPDILMLYESAIAERKTLLKLKLTLIVENSRMASHELHKALVGLCRLGDGPLATQLMLKHYHSRIVTGINSLQSSKSFLYGMYIGELSNFVFSIISQAARTCVMLYGETNPYASEFVQWVQEEIKVFAVSFTKYVKSISDISGGLSTAVEAVQFAMSYSSLLENQRLELWPCLIEHIRPCMEEVLEIHISHFKKVIAILAATDAWVLGRYLVSGIIDESYSSVVVGQQPEYCLLTNSGRKFVTLLQAITKDMTPLVALQMDESILRGLMILFMEYITILERAINPGTNVSGQNGTKLILADSMPQVVSILANLSTLECFFSSTIISVFGLEDIDCINSELSNGHSIGFQQQELDTCVLFIQEASDRLRDQFYQQFICKLVSLETGPKLTQEVCNDNENGMVHDVMPSVAFQVMFLELRKLHKLAEDKVLETEWLAELLRGLIEAIFLWVSNNKEIWETNEDNLTFQDFDVINQFVLDMYFLVEIARYGEYFPKDPLLPETFMNSAFISAGLDPKRNVEYDRWAIKAATEAIQRLLLIEETESLEIHSDYASEIAQEDNKSSSEDSLMSKEDVVTMDVSEVFFDTEKMRLSADLSHPGQSWDLLEGKDGSVDIGIDEASEIGLPTADQASSQHDKKRLVFPIKQLEDERETELSEPGITVMEDSACLQVQDDVK